MKNITNDEIVYPEITADEARVLCGDRADLVDAQMKAYPLFEPKNWQVFLSEISNNKGRIIYTKNKKWVYDKDYRKRY
jgi:hypothetical protein